MSKVQDWFSRSDAGDGVTAFSEPFVHPIFRANMFLVRGRDRDLLVDAGMGLCRLSDALPEGRPVLCVATHIHVDHVGSLHEFQDRAGPASTASAFAEMPDRLTYADEFRGLDEPVSRLPAPDWRARDYHIEPAPLTRALQEGDTIDLGDRSFHVLELPGHSPDCIGLFEEATGILLAGDAIYDEELYDALPCSDRASYRETMRRLLRLPVSIVHGGHGPSFDGARMREIALAYLERRP